jgi:kinesin family protein 12
MYYLNALFILAGKTHTITGPEDVSFGLNDANRWGLVPRSLMYIFDSISKLTIPGQRKFIVRASYLEIYNEKVQDLLNPTNISLPVRWTQEKGFYVENLFVVECEVLDDSIAVLEEGIRNRKTASHRLNEHSSRSHGLLTLYIENETVDPDDQRVLIKRGKMTFVDLAGSERVKESKVSNFFDTRLKEKLFRKC